MDDATRASAAAGERRTRWLPLILGAFVLLPHLGALIPGQTYYFRDFTVTFYPLRLFQARELAQGRWPSWNPYIHEGSFVLPALHPLDLFQAFWSTPAGVSWLLTLQFPLAALSLYALARSLGGGKTGAALSGCVYALGGLALSSLNLYVFLQGLAVTPLVILTFRKAAAQGGRWIPLAALSLSLAVATLAVEFVAQGLLLGLALGLAACFRMRGALRMGLALLLGAGLAALPVAVILAILRESVRGAGFPVDVALANEVHPVALLQVLIPGLFGSLQAPVETFWASPFFSKGFPYFLSLYLGPLVLALAGIGVFALERRSRWVLAGAGLLGLWYSLGARAGLASLLAPWRLARWFRFPSKAFFLPYLALALLAGFGLCRLAEDSDDERARRWRRFGLLAGLAAAIALAPAIALGVGDGWTRWLGSGKTLAIPRRSVAAECLVAGAVALAGVALAWAVRSRRLTPAGAASLLALLVGADLARAAVGMNPQVSPAFFEPLPEMSSLHLDDLAGGRVFTYGLDYSPAFREFLARPQPGEGLWSFFANRQLLAPYSNILDRVELAEAKDVTSFVPRAPELAPEEYAPSAIGDVLPRLKNAAVSRVISLDPLEHADLRLLVTVPVGAPGLLIRVYSVERPWPRAYVACRAVQAGNAGEALELPLTSGFEPSRDVALEEPGKAGCRNGEALRGKGLPAEQRYAVELDGDGYLVMRDSYARGWTATVDGVAARVLRANGKHRAVPLAAGRHEVVLRYAAPGLHMGLAIMAVAAALTVLLCLVPVLRESAA
jgi:hypothetical protein